MAFRVCDYEERNTRGTRRPEIEAFRSALRGRWILATSHESSNQLCWQERTTGSPYVVRELKNVITSMSEERTEGLSIKNMAGDFTWPRPGFDTSPTQKACCRLLGNWRQAIHFDSGAEGPGRASGGSERILEIHGGPTQTRSGRTSTSGGGGHEHLRTRLLMAGTTETEVREMMSRQRQSR